MIHRFRWTCPDAGKLLTGVNKISTFMSRVEKNSTDPEWISKNWSPEDYKGDSLEALVEVLIKSSTIDKRINIVEYRPHSVRKDGPDMGIDGYGISHDGNVHTIQVKYRSNTQEDLTANRDHISNFVSATMSNPKFSNADMTIFTTAKNLNQKINEQMYHNRVRVIGYKELQQLVDNNVPFWDKFRQQMGV